MRRLVTTAFLSGMALFACHAQQAGEAISVMLVLEDGQIAWVNGETSDYYPWAAGEPSYRDADGTAENFLLLWKQNGTWVYNDSRDNPAADFPAAYSGKIAYICETE